MNQQWIAEQLRTATKKNPSWEIRYKTYFLIELFEQSPWNWLLFKTVADSAGVRLCDPASPFEVPSSDTIIVEMLRQYLKHV